MANEVLAHTIISIAGDEPKSVKRLISGDILVESKIKHQTDRLLKAKSFFNLPVTVSPHISLNYSKGVIRSRELKDCSEAELLEELSSQGITANKTVKKKESATPTPNKSTNDMSKIKTYERVIKPLSPAQLKLSTESIEFPPMDVIRSAAEAQETSDNGMDFVTVTASTKGKRGRPPKLPILPPP
ncbi:hypothetical protein GQR58_011830 [Nymphon striatum]|nr:hypothetical protein GQR58_011830 [Nymphon striatum]